MRLIDADQFGVVSFQGKSEDFSEGVAFILEKIDEAPTVEAYTFEQVQDLVALNKKLSEERPHGEWVPGREISQMWTGNNLVGIDYEDFSCSCCGVVVEESTEPEWNFCPNCGADMRKCEENK